jgi:hypothetical protein
MSEVLLRQLQQVLAPWDSLSADDNGTSAPETTLEGWGSTSPQDAIAYARAATTRLELARAALALFTSNAGAFRPVLIKLFRFLFDYVDELRDEAAHREMERLLWQEGESVRATNAAGGGGGLSSKLGGDGATPEEQNAVVAAYEKVRMTESRMAALVEEASVQRDHFKSQIEAQKKRQYHLEDLLQHQKLLTQTLLDHRLQQELVGKGPGVPQSTVAGELAASTTTAPSLTALLAGGGGGDRSGVGVRPNVASFDSGSPVSVASPASPATAVTGRRGAATDAGTTEGGRRPAERRDAAYVQRLIQRAEREFTLEKTEDELRELRAQQDELESKVQSLLKLNTKYARQCIELSARLSILHESNIALAADVQLFQRDYVKEQQRSANLQHALLVARGIVLTTLQARPGYQIDEALAQLDEIDRTSSNSQWRRYDNDPNNNAAQCSRWGKSTIRTFGASTTATTPITPVTPTATTTAAASSGTDNASLPMLQLDSVDEIDEALRTVPAADLRRQLRDVLDVDDVDYGGKVKVALMRLLELHTKLQAQLHDRTAAAGAGAGATAEVPKWLAAQCIHAWAPPYGLRPSIPRHLRSAAPVPLIILNPVLAEALVHELLTQRQQLLAFVQMQREQATVPSLMQGKGRAEVRSELAPPSMSGMQQVDAEATSNSFVSFPDFIELFIWVVWLNRADRYLPLLPPGERTRLEEAARARGEAHARRVSRLVAKRTPTAGNDKKADDADGQQPSGVAKAPITHISLWELRYVLHLVRPSSEAAPLPLEGLQLTYALDVASQQTNVGPLTYAYGLTSRGVTCEVLFYVLRAERETLLSLCRAVDAAVVAHTRGQSRAAGLSEASPFSRFSASVSAAVAPTAQGNLNGYIPTVQFVRILLVMYPGYPARKLEELIEAAVADATTGTESSATLFYEVLLPGRTLPGPTTAATAADTSIATSTRFASSFYAAICDDALASMQVVEDSVFDFVRGQQQQQQQGAAEVMQTGIAVVAGDAAGATASVTAHQITSNAFLGIPRMEAQQWGAGLRSAINRWPRLRSTFADPNKAALTEASLTGRLEDADADIVSSVARVAASDVMPYLRRNVIVRRGLFANAETTNTTAMAAPAKSLTSVPRAAGLAENSIPSLAFAGSTAPAVKGSPAGSSSPGSPPTVFLTEWTPVQARLLQPWEQRWAECINASGAAVSSTATTASNKPSAFFGGMSQASEFVELLQHLDPYRTRPWGSELVSRDNAVLYPLDFTGDWSAEELGTVRHGNASTLTAAALKHAAAKTSKKDAKKAGGAH